MYTRANVFAPLSLVLVLLGSIFASSISAEAHGARRSTDKTSGISIPNLTHGQLHIVSRYQSAILRLADLQVRPSLEARTLQNFVNLQFAYCLWGLIPGSISDEASPFNECSHAHLAATKALLALLQQNEDTRARADALSDKINFAMLDDPIALEICGNSFEPFNTAQIVMPAWSDVSFNPLGILLGFFIFGASAAGYTIARSGWQPGQDAHSS